MTDSDDPEDPVAPEDPDREAIVARREKFTQEAIHGIEGKPNAGDGEALPLEDLQRMLVEAEPCLLIVPFGSDDDDDKDDELRIREAEARARAEAEARLADAAPRACLMIKTVDPPPRSLWARWRRWWKRRK